MWQEEKVSMALKQLCILKQATGTNRLKKRLQIH